MANTTIYNLPALNTVDSTSLFPLSSNVTATPTTYQASIGNIGNAITGNLRLTGDNITSTNNTINISADSNVWNFNADGTLQLPSNASQPGPGTIAVANGYPTILAYGSNIHGGPELDWMDADDPANNFGNANVLRNTMYLNSGGLYIGINENNVVGNVAPNWLFDPEGNLTLPDGTILQNGGGIQYPASEDYEWDLHSSDGNVYIGSVGNMAYIDTYSPNIGVRLRTNDINDWIFDPSGNLTLPNIASPSINYANGSPYGGSGNANTGNVTFNDQVVIGTGTDSGAGGLYLAPGTNSTANLQYLRVRGGDYPTHIHLDTGNNAYYDQYFGDDYKFIVLSSSGNILIRTNDLLGNTAQWDFSPDGNTTFPNGIEFVQENQIRATNANNYLTIRGYSPTEGDGTTSVFYGGSAGSTGNSNVYTGGSARITGGRGVNGGLGGEVRLRTYDANTISNDWYFKPDGNLELADAGVLWNNSGLTTLQAGTDGSQIGSNDGQSYVIANANGTYMQTLADTTNSLWHFGTDGNLTLPANTFAVNYANGTQVSLGSGNANTGNVTFDNVNVIGTGNLKLQPDPANSGSYLDIFLTSGPDLHLVASQSANLILGKDNQANVMTSWNGNVYIQAWNQNTGAPNIWIFDGTGNITAPGYIVLDAGTDGNIDSTGNINIISNASTWTFGSDGEFYLPTGGRIGATKGGTMLDGGNGSLASLTSFYSNGFYSACFTAQPDGNAYITTYPGSGSNVWQFGVDGNTTFPSDGNVNLGNFILATHANFVVSAFIGNSSANIFLNWDGSGNFSGNLTSANANLGNLATANYVNVASNVVTSNLSVNLDFSGNTANFTGNITAINANLGNLATANYVNVASNVVTNNLTINLDFSGNTANFTGNITSLNANLGNLATANYINVASNVVTNNLTINLDFSGNTANFTGNITAINANLGNLATANYINVASNVVTSNLSVNLDFSGNTANFTGNITAINANLGNIAIANYFSTSGTGGDITLTNGNISGANVLSGVTLSVNTIQLTTVAIANLPSATTPGLKAFVSDSNIAPLGNFGVVVSNGGANYTTVFSDGSNWLIG